MSNVPGPHRDSRPETTGTLPLLRAAGRGDVAALASLYDALAPRVHGVALRMLGTPELAERVTHATFLEVWTRSAAFDASGCSVEAWILSLAHRRAVDLVRSSAPRAIEATAGSAVELAYLDGRTVAEVATLMDLSPRTVRRLIAEDLRPPPRSPGGASS